MKRFFFLLAGCICSAGLIAASFGMSHGGTDGVKAVSALALNQSSKESSPIRIYFDPLDKPCHITLIKKVILSSERPGIIYYVKPQEGDIVDADSLIVELRSDVAKAALASAALKAENDVDIRFAKKQYAVSKAEYDLIMQAWEKRPAAVAEIEKITAQLKMERSELQQEQAENQMEIDKLAEDEAEANLKTYLIKAPFKGIVTKLHKRFRGEAVTQGEPILEMANTDYVHVEAELPLKDVLRVKPGCLVEVSLSLRQDELEIEQIKHQGRVVFVDVVATPGDHTVMVKAKVKNPNNILRENLYARMTIYPDREGPKFDEE